MPSTTNSLLLLYVSIISVQYIHTEPSCLEGTKTLLPYAEESAVYWECWNGVKTLKACPDGLWFKEELQTCLHPQNYEPGSDPRCENVMIDFFPDHSDCRRYIECYNGDAYLMACPNGMYFSSEEKTCVDPELSGCVMTPLPELCDDVPSGQIVLKKCTCGCQFYWRCDGQSQTLETCGNSESVNVYFDEERQFCSVWSNSGCIDTTRIPGVWTPAHDTVLTTPGYQDPRCSNQNGIYYSNPLNCSKYIECLQGNNYEYDCPKGLYFSAKEQKCVMPLLSDCGYNDPRCILDVYDVYRYPLDCSLYIQCYNGSTYLMSCPGYYWFSQEEKKCVEPNDSGCDITSTSNTPTPTTKRTSTPTTQWTTTTWTSTPTDSDYVCFGVPRDKLEVKSSEFGCTMYWQCNGTHQTLKQCRNDEQSENSQSPLYFDPDRRLCGATVDCDDNTRIPWYQSTPPTIAPTLPNLDEPRCENFDSFGDWTFWYHPYDCRKFIECYNGPQGAKGYERDCPEGFYFSSAYKACVLPEQSDCKQ